MKMLSKMFRAAEQGANAIDAIVRVLIVVVFVVLFVLLNVQVAMRYVVRVPLIWLEELAGFLFAYLTVWGSSTCIRTDSHVRVASLLGRLSDVRLRHALSILIHGILLFYLYYLVVYGYRFAAMGAGVISPSGTFDSFLPRLSLTTGGALMMIQAVGVIMREALMLMSGPKPKNAAPNAGNAV